MRYVTSAVVGLFSRWYAHRRMAVTEERVLDALRQVLDPATGDDIVSLGVVDNVAVSASGIALTLGLPAPARSLRERLEREVRAALAQHLGDSLAVSVDFPAPGKPQQQPLPGVDYVVAVGSGKGGVGKSTVAANLAASLALDGADVGLLDADIYGPSQAKMYAVEGRRLMADDEKNIIPLKNHGVKVISIANLVEDGQALTWRGPILHGTLTQLLKQTVWGELDYLIVDLPPGTGDVQLSLAQLVPLTGMVLVTTPQDVAVSDVKRAYTMARKTHVPVLGVIENMSYYALPDGERDYIFGEGGAERWASSEGLSMLGSVPITRALRESSDAGAPLVVSHPDNASAQELRRAARGVAEKVTAQAATTLPVM